MIDDRQGATDGVVNEGKIICFIGPKDRQGLFIANLANETGNDAFAIVESPINVGKANRDGSDSIAVSVCGGEGFAGYLASRIRAFGAINPGLSFTDKRIGLMTVNFPGT